MRENAIAPSDYSLEDLQRFVALGNGVVLLLFGMKKRSLAGVCLAAASAPLLYRGLTGRWPVLPGTGDRSDRKAAEALGALESGGGLKVRDAVQLELPVEEVYGYWRQLDNLPRFMKHLVSVTENGGQHSHWVASGPGGVRVEWDAELIEDVPNQRLAWRSLPGSEIDTSGSVQFDRVRGDRSTQVTVDLRYAPPAGQLGALIASLFGRAPSQTIREDLRRFKQILEAGEAAQAVPSQKERR